MKLSGMAKYLCWLMARKPVYTFVSSKGKSLFLIPSTVVLKEYLSP